jgi:hypothetical protein
MSDGTENAPGGRRGEAIFAALLLAAAYAVVNLDRLAHTTQIVTGGWLNLGASRTKTKSFGDKDGAFTLETYWSNGHMYYRATPKMSRDRFLEAAARLKSRGSGKAAMSFKLHNRFGAELVRLEIPAEAFKADEKDSDRVAAVGSVGMSEGDYWEIVDSPSKGVNNLAD